MATNSLQSTGTCWKPEHRYVFAAGCPWPGETWMSYNPLDSSWTKSLGLARLPSLPPWPPSQRLVNSSFCLRALAVALLEQSLQVAHYQLFAQPHFIQVFPSMPSWGTAWMEICLARSESLHHRRGKLCWWLILPVTVWSASFLEQEHQGGFGDSANPHHHHGMRQA